MSYPLIIYCRSHTSTEKTLSFKAFNAFFLSSLSFFPSASRYLDNFVTTSHPFSHPFTFCGLSSNSPVFLRGHTSPSVHSIPCPPSFPTLLHHTVRLLHSLGIWMTVSCGAFCLCWPASASSSCSSRLSFFLPVALSTSHCVIFFTARLYCDFFGISPLFPLSHNLLFLVFR